MKVLVIGATGGSGRAAVTQLRAAGHTVTAFSRRADGQSATGDVMNAADVDRVMPGHDAVVVALGISENPFRVRLRGPAHTPIDVRSRGTRNVIAAMRNHGVRRLVVQSTYGVGATRDRLRLRDRLFFSLVLKPQIADHEEQERVVRESGLDWVLLQPIYLTDGEVTTPTLSLDGVVPSFVVSRATLGRAHVQAVTDDTLVRQSVAVSAAAENQTRAG